MTKVGRKSVNQRLYFDLTNGQETIRDAEGVSANGLDEAIGEAQAVLDEMQSSTAYAPEDSWQLLIRDEDGTILKTLPLN